MRVATDGELSFTTAVRVATDAFFAFTTILGWNYYSERCLAYLAGSKAVVTKIFRWAYILAVAIGPYMTVSAVWTIANIFNGLMAIPNIIALLALSCVVAAETKSFNQRLKEKKNASA